MPSVEILREPTDSGAMGAPAVVARRPAAPGKPTVLLYAHHDVQPPGDEADWNTPVFEATRVGDRLFGRGAADDKAGIMVHIAALRAVLDLVADFGVGVTYFFEGEEEAGSPSFRNFLEAHQDKLAADVIIVADSSNWAVGTRRLQAPFVVCVLRRSPCARFAMRCILACSAVRYSTPRSWRRNSSPPSTTRTVPWPSRASCPTTRRMSTSMKLNSAGFRCARFLFAGWNGEDHRSPVE